MADNEQWVPLELDATALGIDPNPAALVGHLRGDTGLGELLTREKALVFRGFGISEGELDEVFDLLLPNRLAYVHGNSPRTKVGQNVYTSTEYPPEYTISMHNEMS